MDISVNLWPQVFIGGRSVAPALSPRTADVADAANHSVDETNLTSRSPFALNNLRQKSPAQRSHGALGRHPQAAPSSEKPTLGTLFSHFGADFRQECRECWPTRPGEGPLVRLKRSRQAALSRTVSSWRAAGFSAGPARLSRRDGGVPCAGLVAGASECVKQATKGTETAAFRPRSASAPAQCRLAPSFNLGLETALCGDMKGGSGPGIIGRFYGVRPHKRAFAAAPGQRAQGKGLWHPSR